MIGGAIRDFALHKQEPKDLDLIIDCSPNSLSDLMNEYYYQKNRFDGYKLEINNIKIDIWNMSNHWAFKENLYECSFENIAKGAFFNFDAVTINLKDFELDADTFIESYENKILDLNLNEQNANLNPTPEKNIKRAYKLKEMMNFKLTDRLKKYCEYWSKDEQNEIILV